MLDAKKLILIVDDDSANIQSLAQALSAAQTHDAYELRFAKSGATALALAMSAQPALILLDVVMPGMDGIEILEKLQSDPLTRAIPVIFVTSKDDSDDEARGLDLGAVDYITKPISPAIVRARVRTHLELRRQREFEAQRARLDGLTGIANRRAFDESMQRFWQLSHRASAEISSSAPSSEAGLKLMLLDVDHFKRYNDSLGHSAGDGCLQQIAHALSQNFARTDELVARIGGEEFAVLLRGGSLQQHAQRALDAIAQLKIAHPDSSTGKTVSISVGALERGVESDINSFIAAVDVLLYQAKNQGRNRCCLRSQDGTALTVLARP